MGDSSDGVGDRFAFHGRARPRTRQAALGRQVPALRRWSIIGALKENPLRQFAQVDPPQSKVRATGNLQIRILGQAPLAEPIQCSTLTDDPQSILGEQVEHPLKTPVKRLFKTNI